jgi:hypothetical protein
MRMLFRLSGICIPLFQVLADEERQDIIILLAEKEALMVTEIGFNIIRYFGWNTEEIDRDCGE